MEGNQGVIRQGRGQVEQGRVEEGAEIYGWFSEGWDTPDLQEARGLLEELAGN